MAEYFVALNSDLLIEIADRSITSFEVRLNINKV